MNNQRKLKILGILIVANVLIGSLMTKFQVDKHIVKNNENTFGYTEGLFGTMRPVGDGRALEGTNNTSLFSENSGTADNLNEPREAMDLDRSSKHGISLLDVTLGSLLFLVTSLIMFLIVRGLQTIN